jgi:Peptidase S46
VINKQAEIVGIIFDSNMQALPWRYVYDDQLGRSVSVDSRGIVEALRDVYGATALADELTGGPNASAAKHVTVEAHDHQKAKTMKATPATPKK